MATIASLIVKIGGDNSQLRKELAASQRQLRKAFGNDVLKNSKVALGMFAGIGASMAAAGLGAVKLAADLEQTKIAFTNMLHSADKANALLHDLEHFAASTPFTFEQVKGAAQKFLAFGFTAKQVIPVLTAVGDSAAALGMGQEGIDRLTLALGQMAAKGKASGEEMKQLAEAGVPAWKMLADSMHKSIGETMKMVTAGQVNAETALEAIAGGMEKDFGGMMAKQSQSIYGLFSTIVDNLTQIGQTIGEQLVESLNLKPIMEEMTSWIQEFVAIIKDPSQGLSAAIKQMIPPEVIDSIYLFGGALFGMAIPAMSALAVSVEAFIVSMGPFALFGTIVGAAFMEINKHINVFQVLKTVGEAAYRSLSVGFITLRTIFSNVATLGRNMFNILIDGVHRFYPAVILLAGVMLRAQIQMVALKVAQVAIMAIWGAAYGVVMALTGAVALYAVATNAARSASVLLSGGLALVRSGMLLARLGTLAMTAASSVFNMVLRASPIGIVITLLAALGAWFYKTSGACANMGATLESVWSGIVNTVAWGINKVIGMLNKLVHVLNTVGGKVAKLFGSTWENLNDIPEISDKQVAKVVNGGKEMAKGLSETFKGMFSNFSGGGDATGVGAGGIGGGGGGGGRATGGGGLDRLNELKDQAKQIHDSIVDNFNAVTKTKMQLLDIEYQKELDTLNKSKEANEHYTKDLEMLNETYAKKRRAQRNADYFQGLEIAKKIRDMAQGRSDGIMSNALTGSAKSKYEFAKAFEKQVQEVKDYWADFSKEYNDANDEDKARYIESLKERGLAYKLLEDGRIDVTANANAQIAALEEAHNREEISRYRNMVDAKAAIDDAYHMMSLDALKEALDSKTAAQMDAMNTTKELMDTFQEAMLDSNLSMHDVMAKGMVDGFGEMQKSIEGLIDGTKTLGQAMAGLGQAVLKSISQMVAKWISGRIMMAVFGKTMAKQEAASAQAMGASITSAFTAAGMARSIATLGPIAGPTAYWGAMASAKLGGMLGGLGGGSGFFDSLPKLADGGLAHGPTVAMIGEGRHKEAVLPLSEDTFDELGRGISRAQGGGSSIVLNVSALDVDGFDSYLRGKGGAILRKFTQSQHDEFKIGGAF